MYSCSTNSLKNFPEFAYWCTLDWHQARWDESKTDITGVGYACILSTECNVQDEEWNLHKYRLDTNRASSKV